MLEGWHNPTLRHVEGQWRIYSDGGNVFVLLDKAIPAIVAACPGARERLEVEDEKPF